MTKYYVVVFVVSLGLLCLLFGLESYLYRNKEKEKLSFWKYGPSLHQQYSNNIWPQILNIAGHTLIGEYFMNSGVEIWTKIMTSFVRRLGHEEKNEKCL